MLAEASGIEKIILICGYTDLRYGIDGLAQQIGTRYNINPFQKNVLFLFCGRRSDRIKVSYGKVQASFCYISGLKPVSSAGRGTPRKRHS